MYEKLLTRISIIAGVVTTTITIEIATIIT
jgi:hypothetical protein